MIARQYLLLFMVFVTGILLGTVISVVDFASGLPASADVISPPDRIQENQIKVTDNYVLLNVKGAEWARFADTNSMDPFLDKGANALQLVPKDAADINVGDIISYRRGNSEQRIIHRVVYKSEDENGIYFIVKGDNNKVADPGKVRFEQIDRVLFAIIY